MEAGKHNANQLVTEEEERAIAEKLPAIFREFSQERTNLLPILQRIQETFKFLSPGAMRAVANYIGISTSEVYGVATFYNQFRFHPPGRHEIKAAWALLVMSREEILFWKTLSESSVSRRGKQRQIGNIALKELPVLGVVLWLPSL
jgi:NADH:ubiquinone oxidoreductase subunit E